RGLRWPHLSTDRGRRPHPRMASGRRVGVRGLVSSSRTSSERPAEVTAAKRRGDPRRLVRSRGSGKRPGRKWSNRAAAGFVLPGLGKFAGMSTAAPSNPAGSASRAIALLLGAALVLVLILAAQAFQAERSHRATVEGVLRGYADLAAQRFLRQ